VPPSTASATPGPATAPAAAGGEPARYEPTWASVDRHLAAPEWFQDAKFGIYFHWGGFSTAAFGNEWYPRNMYVPGSRENAHHIATYGDPSVWPYDYFLTGAKDKAGNFVQFAPRLTSQGGNWDPEAWAQLFADAGARFAGPVAEHHDGFSMWDSKVNEWNSAKVGPKLDLLAIHAKAIRGQGLRLLTSLHHAYNFNGYYEYVPQQGDPSLRKLFGQLPTDQENQLWLAKLKEVVDGYHPDVLWEDFDLIKVEEQQRLAFLSYYYNSALLTQQRVVATYKDGYDNKGEVFDYERGGPADLTTPYWLTDDSISSSSWGYTAGMGYYTSPQMIHSLIDRVSKNGTMLLNVAPMADGTIPQGQQDILHSIGNYLRQAGESIYDTRSWAVYGEGPTKMGGGSFTGPKTGTNKDIRFTRNKTEDTLYATVLGWPDNGVLTVTTLAEGHIDLRNLSGVRLLDSRAGSYVTLRELGQDSGGLSIAVPDQAPFDAPAYVVELTFNGKIPALTGPASA
jgi:alpha-L-fucosidase